MLVYKCPKCGITYSKKDVSPNGMCFSCDTYLKIINIRNENKNIENQTDHEHVQTGRKSSVGRVRRTTEEKRVHEVAEDKSKTIHLEERHVANINEIAGTIISAISDTGFRRLPWEKMYDKYFYSQSVNDNQNSIYVRCIDESGKITNKTIIMYGQIKGGIGIFRTGMKIRGEGRYNRKNEFVARRLIIENSINISIRTELTDVIYCLSPLIVVIILVFVINLVGTLQQIISYQDMQRLLVGVVGIFAISFYVIGRFVRLPIGARIRRSIWISIILGLILLLFCK